MQGDIYENFVHLLREWLQSTCKVALRPDLRVHQAWLSVLMWIKDRTPYLLLTAALTRAKMTPRRPSINDNGLLLQR